MLSRLSLHNQLLMSYLLLLAVSLLVISFALLVITGSRPAPATPTYTELAAMLQGLTSRNIVPTLINADSRFVTNRLHEELGNFAAVNDIRVLIVGGGRGRQPRILYDSHNQYTERAHLVLQEVSYSSARLLRAPRPGGATTRQIFGSSTDADGTEWLMAGVEWSGVDVIRERGATVMLVVADQQPTASLQDTLNEFSSSLLPALLQAGVVGLIVAVVLALITSRSIARPLQSLSKGASGVAAGDYSVVVPERGPKEVRAVASAFNSMTADVRAAQQSQREFLANVSHDLKTPLTSIQGYSQAIIDAATNDPAKAARVIHDEAARLNRMVVELTDLARLQAGRLSMKMTALDMGEMAAAIGQRMVLVARKKNIAMHIDSGPLPHIAGDGDRLAQVLENLLSNAVKYTPEGGQIWLKTQVARGGVQVTVRDTGIGIPKADLPRVFERFYQVDKSRGPKRGTGLGLAIAREIIQAHGGEIRVHSDGKGTGSTFMIWLPPLSQSSQRQVSQANRTRETL